MFAVRKIIDGKLYALSSSEDSDEFSDCFECWNDPLYLTDLLKDQPSILEHYRIGKKEAIKCIIRESNNFQSEILQISRDDVSGRTLDDIFEPLHKSDDFEIPLLVAKSYSSGRRFLRIYGIRLKDGSYLVVGGIIKLRRTIQECYNGPEILKRLKVCVEYLWENEIKDSFDLVSLIEE